MPMPRSVRGSRVAALLVALALAGRSSANRRAKEGGAPPPSAEDVLLGKAYTGSVVATPRGADGKPLLTG